MKQLSTLLLGVLLLAVGVARGQGGAPVGWLKLSTDVALRNRWSLYVEVETRQGNAQLAGQQLGRVGLRRHLAPGVSCTTGYVLAANAYGRADGSKTPEHRFYQEIALAERTGALRTSHRLRVEERWLRPLPEAAFRFAPRLRYQLRLVVPLHAGGSLPVGGTYLVAADELFASLGRRGNRSFLEENRASAGLGYRFSPLATIELAYLHQTQSADYAGLGLARNAVQLSVTLAAPSRPALVRQ